MVKHDNDLANIWTQQSQLVYNQLFPNQEVLLGHHVQVLCSLVEQLQVTH